jgi:hypothetical protein
VVEHSVLVGTRARNIWATQGFDVLSTVADLHLEPRSGTYKVVAGLPVHARPGERLTTLFLPSMGPQIFRVLETTNLKARAANYDTPILGNPLSFQQAHLEMGALEMGVLEARRLAAERAVLESNP